jgi:predicted RNA-binding Zn ribbon-like protein
LSDSGLIDSAAAVAEDDVAWAIDVREALRALMLANNGGPLDPAAIATINRAVHETGLVPELLPTGEAVLRPTCEEGPKAAVGRLLAIMFAAMAEGTWRRFKACRDPSCAQAFFDTSKNCSGHWCDMAVCGSINKMRTYRERHRARSR